MSTWIVGGRTLEWAQVDVFAEGHLQGNMLAIFPDARGLNDAEMQQLARETNLSETTFVLPGDPVDESRHGVHVRIFTVAGELPFAGHPTLGTAAWLWANHATLRHAPEILLRLQVGTVPVRFTPPAAGEVGVYGEMQQRGAEFGDCPEPAAVAAACSLRPADLHAEWRPQVVSTGLPFLVVPLATLDALARLRVRQSAMEELLRGTSAQFVYGLAQQGSGWRARMPFHGVDDPATGSAAGCAISYLVRHGAVPSGAVQVIEQGSEVHRPSRIHTRALLQNGTVAEVFVGGRTIPVAAGRFTLL